MKRLLLLTDLIFFLTSCLVVYLFFYIPPVKESSLDYTVIVVFLVSLFLAIATGTSLLLYSPHLILKRTRQTSRTKNFIWKDVYKTSLRRGIFLGLAIVGILVLGLFKQNGWLNYVFVIGILASIEVYLSQR